jgi:hypothetical protein
MQAMTDVGGVHAHGQQAAIKSEQLRELTTEGFASPDSRRSIRRARGWR